MKLILLGAPGAGKGTQAEFISQKLDIPTISTGNILRAAVKNQTPIGVKAKEFMDAGQLVPDEVILGIVAERLQEADCQKGYILDGVPRTLVQAESLEAMDIHFDVALSIEIEDATIVDRMSGRRACQGCGATYHVASAPAKVEGVCDKCEGTLYQRDDDKAETVLNRLAVYHAQTAPLKDFYAQRGILKSVDNQPTIEETTVVVMKALELA